MVVCFFCEILISVHVVYMQMTDLSSLPGIRAVPTLPRRRYNGECERVCVADLTLNVIGSDNDESSDDSSWEDRAIKIIHLAHVARVAEQVELAKQRIHQQKKRQRNKQKKMNRKEKHKLKKLNQNDLMVPIQADVIQVPSAVIHAQQTDTNENRLRDLLLIVWFVFMFALTRWIVK